LLNATILEDKIGNISEWKEENRLEISLLKACLLKNFAFKILEESD